MSSGFHFAIVQGKMNKKRQDNIGGIFCVMQINAKMNTQRAASQLIVARRLPAVLLPQECEMF